LVNPSLAFSADVASTSATIAIPRKIQLFIGHNPIAKKAEL